MTNKRQTINSHSRIKDIPKPQSSTLYKSNRWKQASKAYLYKHPLCVMCEKKGITTTSQETDHIKPHRGDVKLFWDSSNWQALCKRCHSIKTAGETRSISRFPLFPIPACKVILVCGPAGSNRLEYIEQHKQPKDIIIDYLTMAQQEFGLDRYIFETQWQYNWAISTRNAIVERLCHEQYKNTTVYVLLDASTQAERKHWQEQLHAEVIVLLKDWQDIEDPHTQDLAKQWWKGYSMGQNERTIRQ